MTYSKNKRCSKCQGEREVKSKRYCHSCAATYMREWRKNHHLTKEQRFKANVRRKTGMRIKRGSLIRQPCEVCDTQVNVEAHHDDYGQPYKVIWLCFKHHRQHHSQGRENAKTPISTRTL